MKLSANNDCRTSCSLHLQSILRTIYFPADILSWTKFWSGYFFCHLEPFRHQQSPHREKSQRIFSCPVEIGVGAKSGLANLGRQA